MIKRVNEVFLNDYFKKQSDFRLVKDFEAKDNMYVGVIVTCNTVHDVSIDVEVPFSFPYHKLVFWTNSLRGYPHLIFGIDPYLKKEIHEDRGWFCLNTPFAETPFAQLEQEMSRLREWLTRYIHPDLPPYISNKKVIRALAIANAYNWENHDEIGERSHNFGLSFVGDFSKNVEYFSEHTSGYLHCNLRDTRNDEFRLFAFNDKDNTDLEVPYLIVDSVCSLDQMRSFAELRAFYGWNMECQERLLPDFDLDKEWVLDTDFYHVYCRYLTLIKENRDKLVIAPEDVPAIDEAIQELEKMKQEPHFLSSYSYMRPPSEDDPDFETKIEEYYKKLDEEEEAEQQYNEYINNWHFFVLGFLIDNHIYWRLFWTKRNYRMYREVSYKFGEIELSNNSNLSILLSIKHFMDIGLNSYPADAYDYSKYFGRGQFCNELVNKKIAIIGAGAIGSSLAISLARGGARFIGLWDGDHVEPGNICRSLYHKNFIGTQKSQALATMIKEISPFCKVVNVERDFYSRINYESQADVIKVLDNYDIIVDCTASNEVLWFLSYAIKDKLLLSLCITNHAQNLLCISNNTGNPFEIQKAFLSNIEQDTDNYYVEGTGCFDPTFLASNSDINALLNLAIRDIDKSFSKGSDPGSVIYSYDDRGILSDHLTVYTLADKSIKLIVSSETLLDAEEVPDVADGKIGQLFGTYSLDGKEIFLSKFVPQAIVETERLAIAEISFDILEYIGEYRYSSENAGEYNTKDRENMASLAADEHVNTYNPLLALRNPDGSVTFFLYIDDKLEQFYQLTEACQK